MDKSKKYLTEMDRLSPENIDKAKLRIYLKQLKDGKHLLYQKIQTMNYGSVNSNFKNSFKRRLEGDGYIRKLPRTSTNDELKNEIRQNETATAQYWENCKKIIKNNTDANKPNNNSSGGKHKKYINLQSGGKRLIRYGKQGGKYYIKNNNKHYIK